MVLRPIHATNIKTFLQNVKSITRTWSSEWLWLQCKACTKETGLMLRNSDAVLRSRGSVKDFKLRNKNTDLHFRQTLTLYTKNATWWEFCLWFLWMSKIITKLHCLRKERGLPQPYRCPLESFFAFFPFSKVNRGSRPLLVPGILCWLLFRGE